MRKTKSTTTPTYPTVTNAINPADTKPIRVQITPWMEICLSVAEARKFRDDLHLALFNCPARKAEYAPKR